MRLSQVEGAPRGRRCDCVGTLTLPDPGTEAGREQGKPAPLPALQPAPAPPVGQILTEIISARDPKELFGAQRLAGRMRTDLPAQGGARPAHSLKECFVL